MFETQIISFREMAHQSRTKGTVRREVDFAVAVQEFIEVVAKAEFKDIRKAAKGVSS